MNHWWRAPLVAAAISTLACFACDMSHRRSMAALDGELASLQQQWHGSPLSKTVDREMDIAGMLGVRRDAMKLVQSKQPSTWATLAAILPPSPMPHLTIGAAGTHFQITGPIAEKQAVDSYLAGAKGITVLHTAPSGQQFVIQGERK